MYRKYYCFYKNQILSDLFYRDTDNIFLSASTIDSRLLQTVWQVEAKSKHTWLLHLAYKLITSCQYITKTIAK